MKKLLAVSMLCIISSPSYAYRQNIGQYGNFDSYYLVTNGGLQVCSARGFYDGNYKVIFNIIKDPDTGFNTKLNVEYPLWRIPPHYSGNYVIELTDLNDNLIYRDVVKLENRSSDYVSQASWYINDASFYSKAGLNGKTLTISGGSFNVKFNISSSNSTRAISDMVSCASNNLLQTQPTFQSDVHQPLY